MRIAVVTEFSVSARCQALLEILGDLGHDAFAAGMPEPASEPTLNYLHTGLITALILHLGLADFVVGGCGTGQGYAISAMQYPGVYCGLLREPLDAWLFKRINGGNCVSLPLNQGYGWAADQGLRMLLTELFAACDDKGYPLERAGLQESLRQALRGVSEVAHPAMADILRGLDPAITGPVFANPAFVRQLDSAAPSDLLTVIRGEFFG